ncbi:M28 family peptidase [Flavisolibacter sp. BT320]|nr:M28 family peptidase [Flavisolibacter longurius]
MKKMFVLLLFGSTLQGFAQKIAKPDPYAKTITVADAKKHLYILAAPEMEGRETGTEGQRKAAAYIENYFKEIGLEPGTAEGYQQYYKLFQDSLLNTSLEVNGKTFELDKDFSTSPNNITATHKLSEVVVLGTKATDSLATTDLTGKMVMVVGQGNMAFYNSLSKKAPAVVLVVSPNFPANRPTNRRGRQGIYSFRSSVLPQQFSISENVAKAIAGPAYDAVKASGNGIQKAKAEVMLDVKKQSGFLPATNVVGVIPGTDLKDEYVVISAHYDHVGIIDGKIHYGADDDGSGTVGIMEIAEAFMKAKKEGKGPRRSIVILAVSGEEKGLLGSEYYSNHPLFPMEKTTVNLNIDMIGRSDPDRKAGDSTNYVYVVGDDKVSSDLKTISEGQNKKYTKMELDYKYNDPNDPNRIYYRSDHYNFAKNGVPIIFYYDGMLRPDYHKPTDTPDKINYELLRKRAQLVFYTAWEMANRNEMLKRDLPLPTAGR